MQSDRDLEFLYEIGSLRHIPRGWLQHLAIHCANDLEHSYRVAFLALILGRRSGQAVNEEKILKMALAHDLPETRVTDLSYVQKVYVQADEARAIHDTFVGTVLADFEQVVAEYHRRDSLEAKLVKDADNLDIDLELKELEEQGHRLPRKWQIFRIKVRNEKLHTDVAQAFWDAIVQSDPSSWHMTMNKWLVMPRGRAMIQAGVYRHYKGKEYLVIGLVTNSETREPMVLYTPRYDNPEGLVVRPLAMFSEDVVVDGVRQPRFQFVREVE